MEGLPVIRDPGLTRRHAECFHMVAYFPMFFGLLLAAAAVLPAPCASTTSDCTEWIKPAGQQSRIRAFVFVHGILRDADNHFRTYYSAKPMCCRLEFLMCRAQRWRRALLAWDVVSLSIVT
jgi:hypothetical protein